MQYLVADISVDQQSEGLFTRHQQSIYKHTDRMFAVLMTLQYIGGIAAAFWFSPKTWAGEYSTTNNNVWAAIFLGGVLSIFPIFLALKFPGNKSTRYVIAIAQMMMSSLLIHLTGGRVETHFHIFGSLAFLSFYRDWRVLVPATFIVAADHILRGVFWPESVYGVLASQNWRWVEHAFWVLFEDTFLFIAIKRSITEMWDIARRTSEITQLNMDLEQRVVIRTAELETSNKELGNEIIERERLQVEAEVIAEVIQGVTTTSNLDELLELVHQSISKMLNAENCYVALYDAQTDLISVPFCIDKYDTVASPAKLGAGLTAYVLRKGRAMLMNAEVIQDLTKKGDILCVGTMPAIWLGVPLRTPEGIIGALVVQHYEDKDAYKPKDVGFLSSVGDQIALSIERKRAQDEIQRRQAEMTVLFDVMPAMIWFKDTENNILRVNKRVAEAAGRTVEEIEGKPALEIYPDESAKFYADDLEVIRSRMPKLGYVEMLPGPDGRKLWVQTDKVPYFDEDAKPIGIVVMAQDVTERKHAEEALRESEEKFRELVENANDVIYTLDMGGNFTSLNRAGEALTGYSRAEAVQKRITDVVAPEIAAVVLERFALNKMGDPQPNAEMEIIAKDGRRLTMDVSSRLIVQGGVPVGLQGIGRDITESLKTRKELERFNEKLKRSNRELEDFAYVASHDLQEPLRKVQAFSDRLRTKYADKLEGDGLDYLERMRSASSRMQLLIQDLLTFSRVSTKGQPFVALNLETITRDVLSDLEVKIEETGATVELKDLPMIDADPMQMRQLMQNLIGNALKFQQKGVAPIIRIQGQQIVSNGNGTVPHCQISVTDNGIGFDEKYTDKIFAVFQRLHGRAEYEGSGVGLSICRKIAERHNGDITARSLPGDGATFIVTLPLNQPQPEMN